MPNVVDGPQHDEVDELVEEYAQRRVTRRAFLQRAAVLGVSASAAASILAACGSSSGGGGGSTSAGSGGSSISTSTSGTVNVLTTWGGEELTSYKAVIAQFNKQYPNIKIQVTSTKDVNALLTTDIAANHLPDLAVLPNPAKMQQLAKQGHLQPLDSFLDMSRIHNDYASTWINLGSYNSKLYAIFYKASSKGTVWYSPDNFKKQNYTVPKTWTDMVNLSKSIANNGKYPWSMGMSSGSASGWPGADWIDQIYLAANGPTMYDKWVAHQIKWTDATVKDAFQKFGQIAHGNHFIQGGNPYILSTSYQDASYRPYKSPPEAYMYYLGDFTEGFITTQFPKLQPGTGFDFFPFPQINSQYPSAVTGGADVVTMLKDTAANRAFVEYLSTAPAQEIWVKRGGFTSVNKSVPLSAYPNTVAKSAAQQLTTAGTFRFGADDLMPAAVETKYWQTVLAYIQDPSKLDSLLQVMENTAKQAYG